MPINTNQISMVSMQARSSSEKVTILNSMLDLGVESSFTWDLMRRKSILSLNTIRKSSGNRIGKTGDHSFSTGPGKLK